MPSESNHVDIQLVERAKAGENGAFDALVIKYQPRVINIVARFVRDTSECQDVAQEVFIKAYRALGNFRGDSAFYTWLYRIAVNTAKNHLASQARRPTDQSNSFDINDPEAVFLPEVLQDYDTPEGLALTAEIQSAVASAIAALPEDLREAITLRELEGMSYDEIADHMQCPIGTVRSRIFRAREAVARELEALEGPQNTADMDRKQGRFGV